jgi:hypothetical protein
MTWSLYLTSLCSVTVHRTAELSVGVKNSSSLEATVKWREIAAAVCQIIKLAQMQYLLVTVNHFNKSKPKLEI